MCRGSLLADVSHDEAKMRERRETSLSFLTFLPRSERPLLAGKCRGGFSNGKNDTKTVGLMRQQFCGRNILFGTFRYRPCTTKTNFLMRRFVVEGVKTHNELFFFLFLN